MGRRLPQPLACDTRDFHGSHYARPLEAHPIAGIDVVPW